MPGRHALACLAVIACVGACQPREPGLHPDEKGATFFWRIAGIPKFAVTPECDGETQPEVDINTSYVAYEVAPDGKTAIAQDCDDADVSTCKDNNPELLFHIDDDVLTGATTAPIEELSDTCTHVAVLDWTVTDEGEEGELLVDGVSDLSGDDCSAFEATITGACVVELKTHLALELVAKP